MFAERSRPFSHSTRMKLFHAADIHLGRARLEGHLPDTDLVAAFRHIAEQAVSERADVFVLAGDLFDRPQVEPRHLRQAQEVLRLLAQAGIPVVAIEGNHDKAFVHSDDGTWVGFLAEDGLVQLLRPEFGPGGAILTRWDPDTRQGAYVDHHGVRFVGAGYLGAATPAKVRQVIQALDGPMPHVLLLHAGPQYFVGEGGGFSKEDLALIREKVTYLALGHIHKPMRHEDWACNPGSPENCDLREAIYSQDKAGNPVPRGYAVVEIDSAQREKPVTLAVRSNPRRPVLRVTVDCTPFGNKTKNGQEALIDAAVKQIQALTPRPEAVIDLRLAGCLKLTRIVVDPAQLGPAISERANVFATAVDPSALNLGSADAGEGEGSRADVPRDELERRAIRALVEKDGRWGLDQETVASLFFEMKKRCARSGVRRTLRRWSPRMRSSRRCKRHERRHDRPVGSPQEY